MIRNSTIQGNLEALRREVWALICEKKKWDSLKKIYGHLTSQEKRELLDEIQLAVISNLTSTPGLRSMYLEKVRNTKALIRAEMTEAERWNEKINIWSHISVATLDRLFGSGETGRRTVKWDLIAIYLGYDSCEDLEGNHGLPKRGGEHSFRFSNRAESDQDKRVVTKSFIDYGLQHFVQKRLPRSLRTGLIALLTLSSLLINTVSTSKGEQFFLQSDNLKFNILLIPLTPYQDNISIETDYMTPILNYLKSDTFQQVVNVQLYDGELPASKQEDEILIIAKKTNADIVIWGHYYESALDDSKRIRIRYNLLMDSSELRLHSRGDSRFQNLNDLERLEKGYLLDDISFIIQWTIGMKYLFEGNYYQAGIHFQHISVDQVTQENVKVLLQLSRALTSTSQYKKALVYYKKLYSIVTEGTSNNKELIWSSHIGMSQAYLGQNMLDSMEYSMKAAYTMYQKYFPQNDSIGFITNQLMTKICMARYNSHLAKKYIKKAEQHLDGDNSLEMINLLILKSRYQLPPIGFNPYLAKRIAQNGLTIRLDNGAGTARLRASLSAQIMASYLSLSNYDSAMYYAKKVLKYQLLSLGPYHIESLNTYNYLSAIHDQIGNIDSAYFYTKHVIENSDSSFLNFDLTVMNYGRLLMKLYPDSLDNAIRYIQYGLEQINAKSGIRLSKPAFLANAALGEAYTKSGDYNKALVHFKIIKHKINQFLPKDRFVIQVHMSKCYLLVGNYEQASLYINEAKHIFDMQEIQDHAALKTYGEMAKTF